MKNQVEEVRLTQFYSLQQQNSQLNIQELQYYIDSQNDNNDTLIKLILLNNKQNFSVCLLLNQSEKHRKFAIQNNVMLIDLLLSNQDTSLNQKIDFILKFSKTDQIESIIELHKTDKLLGEFCNQINEIYCKLEKDGITIEQINCANLICYLMRCNFNKHGLIQHQTIRKLTNLIKLLLNQIQYVKQVVLLHIEVFSECLGLVGTQSRVRSLLNMEAIVINQLIDGESIVFNLVVLKSILSENELQYYVSQYIEAIVNLKQKNQKIFASVVSKLLDSIQLFLITQQLSQKQKDFFQQFTQYIQ